MIIEWMKGIVRRLIFISKFTQICFFNLHMLRPLLRAHLIISSMYAHQVCYVVEVYLLFTQLLRELMVWVVFVLFFFDYSLRIWREVASSHCVLI